MTDEPAGGGAGASPEEDELFRRVAQMLSPQLDPPAMVADLAKQSFGLRSVDAELARLTADSAEAGTAAAVRRAGPFEPFDAPRLLSFQTPALVVELEVAPAAAGRRILGEIVPAGPATIEVRQPGADGPRRFDVDDEGRFVVEGVRPGPFSLTCRRAGLAPISTEWTRLD
jgi:hypothetical protein